MIGARLEAADLTPLETLITASVKASGSATPPLGTPIRAELLSQIMTLSGPVGAALGDWRRIRLAGLSVVGCLDLVDQTCSVAVEFQACSFDDSSRSVDFSKSRVREMSFWGCEFTGPATFEAVEVASDLTFLECWFQEGAFLLRARVEGDLKFRRCMAHSSDAPIALTVDASIIGGLFEVSETRAQGLAARHTRFDTKAWVIDSSFGGDQPLSFEMSRFANDLQLGPRLTVEGCIRIPGIDAGYTVILAGVTAGLPGALSVFAQRARIGGGLSVTNSVFHGPIEIAGSTVERLEISNTTVTTPVTAVAAIAADGIHCGEDIRIGPAARVNGEFRILSSTVGGQLIFVEPVEANRQRLWINAQDIRVGSTVFLEEMHARSQISLAASDLGGVVLDPGNPPKVDLAGAKFAFVNDIDGRALSGQQAVAVIRNSFSHFSIAPYRQFAKWLGAEGDDAGVRLVSIAGERDALKKKSWWRKILGSVFGATVGFGYDPIRAVYWLIGVILIATAGFAILYDGTLFGIVIVAAHFPDGFRNMDAGSTVLFNPLTYAASAVLPAGGDILTSWRPATTAAELATLGFRAFGWILATAVLAGVAARVRRD